MMPKIPKSVRINGAYLEPVVTMTILNLLLAAHGVGDIRRV